MGMMRSRAVLEPAGADLSAGSKSLHLGFEHLKFNDRAIFPLVWRKPLRFLIFLTANTAETPTAMNA